MDESAQSGPAHEAETDFQPGDKVEFVPDGPTGTVRVSSGGFSYVVWDDDRNSEDRESQMTIYGK
jgi:hypothetical protein